MLNKLLQLQELDLRIEAFKKREKEIPAQKKKFEIQQKRLVDEFEERENACRQLTVEQRTCESEIEQKQQQVAKYDQQLFSVKKNEEYQALLHEIDLLKKQIAVHEERVLTIMMKMDEMKARLEEDKARIQAELAGLERQCAAIDEELAQAVRGRKQLERERLPVAQQVDEELLARYKRIRQSKKTGPAVVPLSGASCSGCHMAVPPQKVNEILAGDKIHSCAYCGRLLYNKVDAEEASAEV